MPVCLRTASQVCPGGTTIIPTSSDATLSGLALSGVTLDPTFVSSTETYTATVGNSVMQTTVTATPTHSGATVAIEDGADNALTNPVTLAVGANVIKAVVTAEDTTTMKTYMVTVTREDTTTTTAPVIVTDGVQVTSTPATGDTYRLGETIEITVTFDTAVTVDTSGGTPRIRFVLNGGGNRVVAWAEYSSGSGGTALEFTYTVQADDLDDDGIWLPADFLQLQSGTIRDAADNTVDATLTYVAPGTQNEHKVDPTSSDATLSGLALADSNGNTISLGETFVPATTAYAAFVANGIETVTLTATKNDSNATVAITSDDDTTSRGEAELDLMVGPNTLTVTVTAQDGATMQPYTITVTRAAACTDVWCATLTVQSLSDGRFGCASSQSGKECSAYLTEDEFTHDSTDYEVSGLQLTANGELRLFLAPPNGLTTASQSLVLLVGSERFPFAYADTKEGRARYWTNSGLNWSSGDIVDVRLVEATASNDTTLSDLEIVDSNGDTVALSPPFADDETDYTASVEDGVLQVTVTAAASDASNKLDYLDRNGNALSDADTGATGHQVVLDAGETVVQVQVTAEDGATMTYRVSVMRMLTTGATVLVGNLGETLSNVTSGYNVTGQSFTTGSNPGGYRLTAVAVRVSSHNNLASDSDTHVTLWSIVNNGPDAMIAELTSPPLGTGTRTYTAPAGVFLDPNRSYRVQLNYGLSQNSRAKVRLTLSNRETSGYGWTIGDGRAITPPRIRPLGLL